MDAAKYYRRVCEQLDCRVAVAYLNALRNGSKSCIIDGLSTGYSGTGQDISLYSIASTLTHSGLTEIGYDRGNVGVDVLWAFISAVGRTRSIDTLRITNCTIQEKGQERSLADIGAALGQLHLHTLDLSGTALTTTLFQHFSNGTALFRLMRHKGLRELRLTRCSLGDEHVELMVNALVNMVGSAGLVFAMRKLVLGHNQITDHGCMVLARLLEGEGALAAARLQLLDLQHNELTNMGAEVLFKAMEKAKALAHINMTGNYLGDASIRSLVAAWRYNPGVASQVLLAYSKAPKQWTQEGVMSLVAAATRADHVVVLDIRGLKLTETLALHAICRMVLKSPKMEVLRLDLNTTQDMFELWTAIKVNRTLLQVWVGLEIIDAQQMKYAKTHQGYIQEHLESNYQKKKGERGAAGKEESADRPDDLKPEVTVFDYLQGQPLASAAAVKKTTPPIPRAAGGEQGSPSSHLTSGSLRIRTQRLPPVVPESPAVASTPSRFNLPTMHWMSGDSPTTRPNGWHTPESSIDIENSSQQSSYPQSSSVSPVSSQQTSFFSEDRPSQIPDAPIPVETKQHLETFDLRSLTGYGTKYQYNSRKSSDNRSVAPSVAGSRSTSKGRSPWGVGPPKAGSRSGGSRAGSVMGDRRPPQAQSEKNFLASAIAFRKYDTNKDLLVSTPEMVMALGDTGVLVGLPAIRLSEYLILNQSSQVTDDEVYNMTDFMHAHDLVLKFKALQQPGCINVSVPIGAGTNKPLKRVFKAYCMSGGGGSSEEESSAVMPLMLMHPIQFRTMCADAGLLQPLGLMTPMSMDIVFAQCKDREKIPRLNWINFLKALVVISQEVGKTFEQLASALTSMPLPTTDNNGLAPVRFVALHEMDSLRNISAKVAAQQKRAGGRGRQRRGSACSYTSDSSFTSSNASILHTVA